MQINNKHTNFNILILTTCLFLFHPHDSQALVAKAAKEIIEETSEILVRKGLARSTQEGTKIAEIALEKYGDDGLHLVKQMGYHALETLDAAGVDATRLVKFHKKYGDKAFWIIQDKYKTALFIKNGDIAGEALVKFPGLSENLIENFGVKGAQAFQGLARGEAVRLAKLNKEGLFKAHGRSSELLDVIGRYGSAGLNFIWNNKGSLAVGAVLTTFRLNPEAYINGTLQLTKQVVEVTPEIVAPVAKETATMAAHILTSGPFLAFIIVVLGVLFLPSIVSIIIKTISISKPKQ